MDVSLSKKRSLKNIFVMPRFQWRLIGLFSSVVGYSIVLTSLLVLLFLIYVIGEAGIPLEHLSNKNYIHFFIMGSLLLIVVAFIYTFLISIYMSHKIAGSIYALKDYITHLRDGDFKYQRNLRDGDEFFDVLDELKSLGQVLDKKCTDFQNQTLKKQNDTSSLDESEAKESIENSGGFSLVEIMIAMLVGVIVLGGAVTVVLTMGKFSRTYEVRINAGELGREVENFLLKESSCGVNLLNKRLKTTNTGTGVETFLQLNNVRDSANTIIFQNNLKYGSPQVTFNGVEVENVIELDNVNYGTQKMVVAIAKANFTDPSQNMSINTPLFLLPLIVKSTTSGANVHLDVSGCESNAMSPWVKKANGDIYSTYKLGLNGDANNNEILSTGHGPMQVMSGGHTGIRITNRGAPYPGIYLETIKSGGMMEFRHRNKNYKLLIDQNNRVGIYSRPPLTSQVTIYNNGNVPDSDIGLDNGNAEYWKMKRTGANDFQVYRTGGEGNFTIKAGSTVVNSTTFDPTVAGYKFYVSGTASGNEPWLSPSDERLKDGLKPVKSLLDKILKLNGVSYELKDKKSQRVQWGFVAQELEKIFPELVSGGGYRGVFLSQVVAPIIGAINELRDLWQEDSQNFEAFQKELCEKHPQELICQ